jgi:selenide,water dikinase
VPLLPRVRELINQGVVPGGTWSNKEYADSFTTWGTLADDLGVALADAQTSGGLLIAVHPDRLAQLVSALERAGAQAAAVVGELTEGERGRIAMVG